ncbi:hypothetical protein, partial [Rosenbergiella nectarea]
GILSARRRFSLFSQGLNNDRGLIQAGEAVAIALQGGRLTNRDNAHNGGILSQGRLSLSSGELDNSQGLIATRDTSTFTTAAL